MSRTLLAPEDRGEGEDPSSWLFLRIGRSRGLLQTNAQHGDPEVGADQLFLRVCCRRLNLPLNLDTEDFGDSRCCSRCEEEIMSGYTREEVEAKIAGEKLDGWYFDEDAAGSAASTTPTAGPRR